MTINALSRKPYFRTERHWMAVLASMLFLFSSASWANTPEQQVKQFVTEAVSRFASGIGSDDYRIEIKPLRQQASCATPLAMALSDPEQPTGRQTITLECEQPKYWKARVQANIDVYLPLMTAATTLNRGQLIERRDLSPVRTNISYLRQGYFTEKQSIVGTVSRRKITAGRLITPRMIELPDLVERDDVVLIEASAAGMVARMKGIALSDGHKGETIRIRNLSSGKEITATVLSANRVKTHF